MKRAPILLSLVVVLYGACDKAPDEPVALVNASTLQKHLDAPRQGPLLLVFWATWCAPCIAEIPVLQELQNDSTLDLQIVSCSLDSFLQGPEGGRQLVLDFLAETPLPWKQVVYDGSQDELFKLFRLSGMIPYSILYDAQGNEVRRFTGRFQPAQVHAALASSSL